MKEGSLKGTGKGMRPANGSTLLTVRVSPGSRRSRLKGYNQWRDEWELEVSSPPRKGEANMEVIRLLSNILGVAERDLVITHGSRDARKIIQIRGLEPEVVSGFLGCEM